MKVEQIRKEFVAFFSERQHKVVSSSPIVPPDDPTLLFTTAGMVQFKPLYAGSGDLPYRRACSVQKCMRAGGKGSDLENVGRTLRHHTFFEMLGNFSFGDYFKREALTWAWEFSTTIMKFEKSRLYASVYEDDDEAWDIWTKEIGIPEDHMVRLGARDNFWGPAGDTGACGPCSEIYYDRGEEHGPGLTFQHATIHDEDPGSRYLEFWNCVFPQFDQQKDGTRLPLKNRGVDTGMGLERLACIAQKKNSPFEIDTMQPIVDAVCQILHIQSYSSSPLETRQCVNVIADHVRALTFVLSEGILPSNEGRGYVMRRLLRRAARYARRIGQETPFMYRVVDTVIEVMGDAYPEIRNNTDVIKRVINQEEETYSQTLGSGLQKLESILSGKSTGSGAGTIQGLSGQDVFQLVTTYGFPLDDIQEIADDRGISIDTAGYKELMQRHRDDSRKGVKGAKFEGIYERLKEIAQEHGKTEFVGYPPEMDESLGDLISDLGDLDDPASLIEDFTNKIIGISRDKPRKRTPLEEEFTENDVYDEPPHSFTSDTDDDEDESLYESYDLNDDEDVDEEYPVLEIAGVTVLAMFKGDEPVMFALKDEEVAVVLNATPFYAESGGQVGDSGYLQSNTGRMRVIDCQKTAEDVYVHYGFIEGGELREGDDVIAEIDADRRWAIMRNHTATHLLQGALKTVVGQHVTQQGSYVGPDYLRFDFTNPESITEDQLEQIETLVNEQIRRDVFIESRVMNLEEARKTGAIAPFGEKYGQTVRVVDVPDWDVEFCGGTHMPSTGGIGTFIITSESAIASGVRRLEAITGEAATSLIVRERRMLKQLSEELSVPRERIPERIHGLQEELKLVRKQLSQLRAKVSAWEVESLLPNAEKAGDVTIVTHQLKDLSAQELREAYDTLKARSPSALVAVLGSSSEGKVTLIAGVTPDLTSRLSAGDLVKQIAPIVGGSGGGKKEMAQAGGKHPEKIQEALQEAKKLILGKLNQG